MEIISTVTKFDKIKNKEKGFIVITTQSHEFNIIHRVSCSYIMKKHFIKKMDSKGKKGDYLWFDSIDQVKQEFSDLRDCKQCNPLDRKLRFS